jgi:hypothetical protein
MSNTTGTAGAEMMIVLRGVSAPNAGHVFLRGRSPRR